MVGSECKTERCERLQDQIIEEIQELEHTKTEEASQISGKEHDLWMYQNEKEEAKRLQGALKPRKRMRKWCGHHQEISRIGLTGKRRQR